MGRYLRTGKEIIVDIAVEQPNTLEYLVFSRFISHHAPNYNQAITKFRLSSACILEVFLFIHHNTHKLNHPNF